MSKKVKLTYRRERETTTEVVTQLETEEAYSEIGKGNPIPVLSDEGMETTKNTTLKDSELMMFEDEDGPFVLPVENIIIVQPIEEGS